MVNGTLETVCEVIIFSQFGLVESYGRYRRRLVDAYVFKDLTCEEKISN